jgi:hypothetical protein
MVRSKRLLAHLRFVNLKRIHNTKVASKGNIANRVKVFHGDDVKISEELTDLNDLSEYHLEMVVQMLRERHWD